MAHAYNSVYIEKANLNNVPSDAVLLSRNEAVDIHWKTIYNWKPKSEVWPFRFGLIGLSALSGISALIITNHYRNKLKLLSFGRLPMYVPTVFFPSIISVILHQKAITTKIVLQEECPVCIQARAVALQCGVSVLYPIVLAPVSGFYFAMMSGSYNVPPIQKQYLPELAKLWYNMSRKLRSTFPILLGINFIAASVVTYLKQYRSLHCNRKCMRVKKILETNC